MTKISIHGWSMHYQSRSEGSPVVLIHGLTGDMAFWHPVIVGGLAAAHQVILVDLRGHGHSDTPPTGYTTRDMADDILDLLDRLGIGRAHIVGHSYGGAVALHFAAMHPDRISGLVLADSRVRSLQPDCGVGQWAHWERVSKWLGRHGIDLGDDTTDPDFGLLEKLARCRLEGKLEGLTAEPFFLPFAAGNPHRAQLWLKLIEETTAIEDFKLEAGLTVDAVRSVTTPTLAVYGGLSHCLPTRDALIDLMPDCHPVTLRRVVREKPRQGIVQG